MRFQTFLVLILALVCGGAAVVGVKEALQAREPSGRGDTVPVLGAAGDGPPVAVVAADMVKTQDWPKDLVPAGALTKAEDAVDRAVLNPLVRGDVVLDAKLAPRGAGRGMAAQIPRGKRAFTIHTPTIEAGVA